MGIFEQYASGYTIQKPKQSIGINIPDTRQSSINNPIDTTIVKTTTKKHGNKTTIEATNKEGIVVDTTTITNTDKNNVIIEKNKVSNPTFTEYTNTFINDKGQGFSSNPDLVVKNISNKPYGFKDITYFSGRKEKVNTGTNNIYGREYVTTNNVPMFQTPPKNNSVGVLRRGYYNLGITESALLSNMKEQSALSSMGKPKKFNIYNASPLSYENRKQLPSATGLFVIGAVKGVTTPIVYPKETLVGLYTSVRHPVKAVKNLIIEAKTNPFGFAGGLYGTGKLFKVGEATSVLARNTKVALLTKDVDYEKYLDVPTAKKVLAGEKAFPLAKSIPNALTQFRLGKTNTGFRVLSASDNPIKTLGQSRNIIVGKGTGVGRTEGLYASPYTKGSPFFFRIKNTEGYSYSILPKFASKPTLSLINVNDIVRIPKPVLLKGVANENLYLQTQGIGSTGKAFITGNLERRFNPKLSVEANAFKTSEAEVVIPTGSILKKTTLLDKESFKYSYYRIPVKEYNLVSKDVNLIGKVSKRTNFKNPFIKEGKFDSATNTYYIPKKNYSVTGSVGKSLISRYKGSSSTTKPYSYSSSNSYKPYSYTSSTSYKSSSSSGKYSISRGIYSSKYSSSSSKGYSSSNIYSSKGSSNYYPQAFKNTFKNFDTTINKRGTNKVLPTFKLKDKVKYQYTPSIEASLFNIRSSKVNLKQARSGLFVRPITWKV